MPLSKDALHILGAVFANGQAVCLERLFAIDFLTHNRQVRVQHTHARGHSRSLRRWRLAIKKLKKSLLQSEGIRGQMRNGTERCAGARSREGRGMAVALTVGAAGCMSSSILSRGASGRGALSSDCAGG